MFKFVNVTKAEQGTWKNDQPHKKKRKQQKDTLGKPIRIMKDFKILAEMGHFINGKSVAGSKMENGSAAP